MFVAIGLNPSIARTGGTMEAVIRGDGSATLEERGKLRPEPPLPGRHA